MQAIWSFVRRYWIFLSMMLAGLVLLSIGTLLLQKQMNLASIERLQQIAKSEAAQLEDRVEQQQEVLLGLQAALTLNPTLDRSEFYKLLLQSNVMYRQASLLAVGLARPVELANLPQHIDHVRADKRVAPLAYQNYTPGPIGSAEPLLLEHLYPINRLTESLIGNNLAESSLLKDGLNAARDEGRMLVSPVFELDRLNERVYCLYAPIYRDLPIEPTVEERQRHHVGTIIAYVRLNEVLRPLDKALSNDHFGWQLFDQGYNIAQAKEALRQNGAVAQGELKELGAVKQRLSALVHLPGRQWRLEFHSYDELLSEHHEEWLILVFGVGAMGLLLVSALMQYLFHSRQWALEMLMQAKGDEFEQQSQVKLLAQWAQESHDPLILRQPDGKIVYANLAAEQLFSPEQGSLLGRFEALLSHSEMGEVAHAISFSIPYPPKAANPKQLEVQLQPIRNAQLQTIAVAMLVRDISAQSAEKCALLQESRRLVEMVELSSDWFWEQDSDARFTVVTGGFFSRFDVSPSFFIGKHRWDLGNGGLTQAQWDAHRAVLAAHQPYRDFEYTATYGRETVILSVSGIPFNNEDGQFMGYRGIGRDITGIRMAQKALISEQQRAQATLESIADGVITTDIFGRVDYLNPVASSLIGWDLAAARGQNLAMIYQSVDGQTRLPLADLVSEALKDGGQYHGARRSVLLNKFGLNFQIEECAARIRDEQMRTIGAVLVFRDVSNWREVDDRVDFDI